MLLRLIIMYSKKRYPSLIIGGTFLNNERSKTENNVRNLRWTKRKLAQREWRHQPAEEMKKKTLLTIDCTSSPLWMIVSKHKVKNLIMKINFVIVYIPY